MKRCDICGSEHEETAVHCSACGEASWSSAKASTKASAEGDDKPRAKRPGKKSSAKASTKASAEESEDQPGADGADDNETR